MPDIINSIVTIAIALTVLFLLTATLILPQFQASYGNFPYCQAGSGVFLNTSGIDTAQFKQECYTPFNNTYCVPCTNWGYKTTTQGLMLLVLVIGLIAFAVWFLGKVKK